VGKTTTAGNLAVAHRDHVETVSFGQLVYEAVAVRTTPMTYQDFRATAASVVTAGDLLTASNKLAARVEAPRGPGKWPIVESHAVAEVVVPLRRARGSD
jgi:hypothetical protein